MTVAQELANALFDGHSDRIIPILERVKTHEVPPPPPPSDEVIGEIEKRWAGHVKPPHTIEEAKEAYLKKLIIYYFNHRKPLKDISGELEKLYTILQQHAKQQPRYSKAEELHVPHTPKQLVTVYISQQPRQQPTYSAADELRGLFTPETPEVVKEYIEPWLQSREKPAVAEQKLQEQAAPPAKPVVRKQRKTEANLQGQGKAGKADKEKEKQKESELEAKKAPKKEPKEEKQGIAQDEYYKIATAEKPFLIEGLSKLEGQTYAIYRGTNFGDNLYLKAIEGLAREKDPNHLIRLLGLIAGKLAIKPYGHPDKKQEKSAAEAISSDRLKEIVQSKIDSTSAKVLIRNFIELYKDIYTFGKDSPEKENLLAIVRYCFRGRIKEILENIPSDTPLKKLEEFKSAILKSDICTHHRKSPILGGFGRTETAKFVKAAFDAEIAKRQHAAPQLHPQAS